MCTRMTCRMVNQVVGSAQPEAITWSPGKEVGDNTATWTALCSSKV